MKPIRLATLGIIAAASLFGAVAASAAPVSSPGVPQGATSLVTPVGCWWAYGVRHCRYVGYGYGYHPYYRPYYRPYRYRY
jgi:hypothetical protein